MPVPKPVTMILPNYLPHKTRNKRKVTEEAIKVTELVFKHATVQETEEANDEFAQTFTVGQSDCDHDIIERDTDSEVRERCKEIQVHVLECAPEPPSEPKKKDNQSCKKHSRCHCNLLSLDTSEFFSIKA